MTDHPRFEPIVCGPLDAHQRYDGGMKSPGRAVTTAAR